MLVVRSDERRSCVDISQDLKTMFQRCQDDANYAIASNPWPMRNRNPPQFVELQAKSVLQEVDEEDLHKHTPAASYPITRAPAVQPPTPRKGWYSRIPRLMRR